MTGRVLVIGAGPAGMSAAIEAGKRGCEVIVVDEAPRPGGQIYRQSAKSLASTRIGLESEQSRKHALINAFESMGSRIDYRPQTTAYAVFEGPVVHLAHVSNSETIRPDAVVIATGVGERAVPFPGWTLPGVVYAGGVQALMKSTAVRAGDRVVVAGTGPLPVAVAAQLVEAGAEVRALALLHPLSVMAKKTLGFMGRPAGGQRRDELSTYPEAGRSSAFPRLDSASGSRRDVVRAGYDRSSRRYRPRGSRHRAGPILRHPRDQLWLHLQQRAAPHGRGDFHLCTRARGMGSAN